MTETAIIKTLQHRRDQLIIKGVELIDAEQLVHLSAKTGQLTTEVANAKKATIAAERSVVNAVLANTETILAELIAAQPLELRVADIADIVALFEHAFIAKTPSPAALAAIDRLRLLARLSPKLK